MIESTDMWSVTCRSWRRNAMHFPSDSTATCFPYHCRGASSDLSAGRAITEVWQIYPIIFVQLEGLLPQKWFHYAKLWCQVMENPNIWPYLSQIALGGESCLQVSMGVLTKPLTNKFRRAATNCFGAHEINASKLSWSRAWWTTCTVISN